MAWQGRPSFYSYSGDLAIGQRQNRPAASGPKGGLFPTPADKWGRVERPCVSNHHISMPSFFHSDILALKTLVIQNHIAHLTLSLEPPIPGPPIPVFAIWGFTQMTGREWGSWVAPGCPLAQTDTSTHQSMWVTQIPESQKEGEPQAELLGLNWTTELLSQTKC